VQQQALASSCQVFQGVPGANPEAGLEEAAASALPQSQGWPAVTVLIALEGVPGPGRCPLPILHDRSRVQFIMHSVIYSSVSKILMICKNMYSTLAQMAFCKKNRNLIKRVKENFYNYDLSKKKSM